MINKKNILDHQIRQEIYKSILKNPGLHFSELSRKLNIPKSTLDYHINFLMKNNFISVRNDGSLKRFYIYDKVGTKDKKLLGFLRKEVPFKIILNLLFPGYCSESELSKDLKLAFSTVNFHINKLLNKEIIKTTERKNDKLNIPLENKVFKIIKKQGRKEIFYTFKDKKFVFSEYVFDTYFIILIFNSNVKFGLAEHYLNKSVNKIRTAILG